MIQKLISAKSYVEECGGRKMFIGRMGRRMLMPIRILYLLGLGIELLKLVDKKIV